MHKIRRIGALHTLFKTHRPTTSTGAVSTCMPMLPDFRLNTTRLAFRPVTPADRADLVALEADPEVMRFLNGGRPVPSEGCIDGDFLTPRGTEPEVLAAHERATGHFVGWFALFDDGVVDGLKTAELGYRLRREAWGKGYATRAPAPWWPRPWAAWDLTASEPRPWWSTKPRAG